MLLALGLTRNLLAVSPVFTANGPPSYCAIDNPVQPFIPLGAVPLLFSRLCAVTLLRHRDINRRTLILKS